MTKRQKERALRLLDKLEREGRHWAETSYSEGLDDGRGVKLKVRSQKHASAFQAAERALRKLLGELA